MKDEKLQVVSISPVKRKVLIWRSLGFLFLIILIARINWDKTIQVLKGIKIGLFLIACLLEPTRMLIEAFRWKLLLLFQNFTYKIKDAFLVLFASSYLGHITPGRLGSFIRGFYLSRDLGIPLGLAFSSVIIDKYLELMCLFFVGSIAAFVFLGGFRLVYFLVCAGIFLWLIYMLIYSKRVQLLFVRLIEKKFTKLKLRVGIDSFREGLNLLGKKAMCLGSLTTFTSFFLYFLHGYLIAEALGIRIHFLDLAWSLALTRTIARIVPLSFSGWGSKDVSLIFIFKDLGISVELAFAFTILFLFSSYFVSLLLGFIAWEVKGIYGKEPDRNSNL